MQEVSSETVSVVAGLVVGNIGTLIAFFMNLKIGQAVLKVKVDRLEKDLNNIANINRRLQK